MNVSQSDFEFMKECLSRDIITILVEEKGMSLTAAFDLILTLTRSSLTLLQVSFFKVQGMCSLTSYLIKTPMKDLLPNLFQILITNDKVPNRNHYCSPGLFYFLYSIGFIIFSIKSISSLSNPYFLYSCAIFFPIYSHQRPEKT